jgi:hypothetical protein
MLAAVDVTRLVAAILVGLVAALIVRGLYVAFRNRKIDSDRRVRSWWLVPLAIWFASISLAQVQRDKSNNAAPTSAENRATARERCTTKVIENAKTATPAQRVSITYLGKDIPTAAANFCAKADRMRALAADGSILPSDAFTISTCADGVLGQFDRIPKEKRGFTRADFRIFAQRYCEEGVRRNYLEGARLPENQKRLVALQQSILRELIRSGKVHQLP